MLHMLLVTLLLTTGCTGVPVIQEHSSPRPNEKDAGRGQTAQTPVSALAESTHALESTVSATGEFSTALVSVTEASTDSSTSLTSFAESSVSASQFSSLSSLPTASLSSFSAPQSSLSSLPASEPTSGLPLFLHQNSTPSTPMQTRCAGQCIDIKIHPTCNGYIHLGRCENSLGCCIEEDPNQAPIPATLPGQSSPAVTSLSPMVTSSWTNSVSTSSGTSSSATGTSSTDTATSSSTEAMAIVTMPIEEAPSSRPPMRFLASPAVINANMGEKNAEASQPSKEQTTCTGTCIDIRKNEQCNGYVHLGRCPSGLGCCIPSGQEAGQSDATVDAEAATFRPIVPAGSTVEGRSTGSAVTRGELSTAVMQNTGSLEQSILGSTVSASTTIQEASLGVSSALSSIRSTGSKSPNAVSTIPRTGPRWSIPASIQASKSACDGRCIDIKRHETCNGYIHLGRCENGLGCCLDGNDGGGGNQDATVTTAVTASGPASTITGPIVDASPKVLLIAEVPSITGDKPPPPMVVRPPGQVPPGQPKKNPSMISGVTRSSGPISASQPLSASTPVSTNHNGRCEGRCIDIKRNPSCNGYIHLGRCENGLGCCIEGNGVDQATTLTRNTTMNGGRKSTPLTASAGKGNDGRRITSSKAHSKMSLGSTQHTASTTPSTATAGLVSTASTQTTGTISISSLQTLSSTVSLQTSSTTVSLHTASAQTAATLPGTCAGHCIDLKEDPVCDGFIRLGRCTRGFGCCMSEGMHA